MDVMFSILIIEDDITFSLMLKTWLGKKGFEVTTTSSISEAKSKIENGRYDLILSDLRLPDGNGIDLLKWAKNNLSSLPFIMMTSYADIQTAVQAMKLGASDYISKPLNPDELFAKMQDVLKGEKSEKQSKQSNGNSVVTSYIEGQSQAAHILYDHDHNPGNCSMASYSYA